MVQELSQEGRDKGTMRPTRGWQSFQAEARAVAAVTAQVPRNVQKRHIPALEGGSALFQEEFKCRSNLRWQRAHPGPRVEG